MMTTVNEDYNDKTKVPAGFIFRNVLLVCFLKNSMSKLIHNRCTCKLIVKEARKGF